MSSVQCGKNHTFPLTLFFLKKKIVKSILNIFREFISTLSDGCDERHSLKNFVKSHCLKTKLNVKKNAFVWIQSALFSPLFG